MRLTQLEGTFTLYAAPLNTPRNFRLRLETNKNLLYAPSGKLNVAFSLRTKTYELVVEGNGRNPFAARPRVPSAHQSRRWRDHRRRYFYRHRFGGKRQGRGSDYAVVCPRRLRLCRALLLSQSRIMLAMARDGLLPAGFFGAVHQRF